MPTYEYECLGCERRFDIVQSFSDAPLTVCDACGGELRKVFSGVGISFKGSGFYRNCFSCNIQYFIKNCCIDGFAIFDFIFKHFEFKN